MPGKLTIIFFFYDGLQSPDINVIENVWRVLKIHIKRRVNYIKTKAGLERVVTEVWTSLPLHYIQSLYQSLPK